MICLRLGNFFRNERNAGSNSTLVRKYPMIPRVSRMQTYENDKDIFLIKTGGIV